jgi:hypothetical protein
MFSSSRLQPQSRHPAGCSVDHETPKEAVLSQPTRCTSRSWQVARERKERHSAPQDCKPQRAGMDFLR